MKTQTFSFVICFVFSMLSLSSGITDDQQMAGRYLKSGILFLENGQESEGIRDLESVINSFSDTPEARKALYHLSDYFLKKKQREKAIPILKRLISD
ncbi:hypothetical protein JW979_14340, partial [bacterium]|nr:hypothetical protein [candidate division CSSED10-310 bacterium]